MNIAAVCFLGIITAVVSLSLRRHNAEISMLTAVAGCALVFVSVLLNLGEVISSVKSFFEAASVNVSYVAILLKAVGICFLTEFAYDCCIDAGQRALGGNVLLAGKVFVVVTALPLYRDILDAVTSLTGGS